jgi:hypothetical protein
LLDHRRTKRIIRVAAREFPQRRSARFASPCG